MSSINDRRASVEMKLDRLDARADSFQAVFAANKSQLDERIQKNQQEVRRALDKLTTDIAQHKEFSNERKQAIRSLVDNLNEQMAVDQTAARETLAYARRQIQEGVRKIEAELEAALVGSEATAMDLLREPISACALSIHRLDADLEAAETIPAGSAGKDAAFGKRRKELAQQIANFKQRLRERKTRSGEQLARFEKELNEEFEKIAKRFKDPFA